MVVFKSLIVVNSVIAIRQEDGSIGLRMAAGLTSISEWSSGVKVRHRKYHTLYEYQRYLNRLFALKLLTEHEYNRAWGLGNRLQLEYVVQSEDRIRTLLGSNSPQKDELSLDFLTSMHTPS